MIHIVCRCKQIDTPYIVYSLILTLIERGNLLCSDVLKWFAGLLRPSFLGVADIHLRGLRYTPPLVQHSSLVVHLKFSHVVLHL